jgi:ATP-dependent RNA helicase RhlE
VVNYELPNVPEDYVHRIGRTARAGGSGAAVSLVSPDETPLLRDIEQVLRRTLPVAALPTFKVSAPPANAAREPQPGAPGGAHRQGHRPQGPWQGTRRGPTRSHGSHAPGSFSRARRSV